MYRIILAAIVMGMSLNLDAQTMKQRDVPEAVISKIKSLYPGASKIKWGGEDGMYEASFLSDKKEMSVLMRHDGMVILTEVEMAVAELPASITEYVSTHHPSLTIEEAEHVTDHQGNVQYEVEVDGVEYLFDSNGRLLSQEKDDEDENDD